MRYVTGFIQERYSLTVISLIKKNWYSIPYEYVVKMVDIKVTETTLTTYYQNKRINVHRVFPDYVINKFHK